MPEEIFVAWFGRAVRRTDELRSDGGSSSCCCQEFAGGASGARGGGIGKLPVPRKGCSDWPDGRGESGRGREAL
jgi:hypothetical protein